MADLMTLEAIETARRLEIYERLRTMIDQITAERDRLTARVAELEANMRMHVDIGADALAERDRLKAENEQLKVRLHAMKSCAACGGSGVVPLGRDFITCGACDGKGH